MDDETPRRRRRSRNRFNDIPDLTAVPHTKRRALELRPVSVDHGSNVGSDGFRGAIVGASEHEKNDSNLSLTPDMEENNPFLLASSSTEPVEEDENIGSALEVLRLAVMDGVHNSENLSENHFGRSEENEPISEYDNALSKIPLHDLRISNWRVLWSLIRTNGSQKFTKTGYQAVRNLIEVISRTKDSSWRGTSNSSSKSSEEQSRGLPHFSTLHKHYRPILLNELAPRYVDNLLNVDTSKAGARAAPLISDKGPQCRVRTILPSEYARADIATPPVWSQLKSTSLAAFERKGRSFSQPTLSSEECVDVWPIIAAREWFYGPQTTLHLDVGGDVQSSSPFAENGDVITVTLLDTPRSSSERFQRCFCIEDSSLEYKTARGTIVHCWTVHHPSRRSHASFSSNFHSELSIRDRKIVERFSFSSYTSPSDSLQVVVPDLPPRVVDDSEIMEFELNEDTASERAARPRVTPELSEAMRKRREALKKRKEEMRRAWRNWQKPILKPGDFVTMLRPCVPLDFPSAQRHEQSDSTLLISVDMCSRVFVVSRFWVEKEEKDIHLFWISGSECMETDYSNLPSDEMRLRAYCAPILHDGPQMTHLDVRRIDLTAVHDGNRGPARYKPISSLGTLISGEEYFVYRFILYWDGFEVQKGKSATGEGFYLICLNLPLSARGSPSAVRVLSLTPPGVSPEDVLNVIFADVLEGMTTGFLDYDADGKKRRIFLDLVAFLGDTPAINSFLDVLGHTATACCHLCRFLRRSTSLIGSRFAVGGSHGTLSHTMRTFFQHIAVRDSGAMNETCRLLGMKSHLSPTAKVMLQLREKMFNASHSIPKTATGQSVVPHFIDPYCACLIAPDHLLTGHLRDCITLALRLLPSNFYRAAVERFMIGFLKDASLPIQNRLVDHKKKSLFSMTMSELYALSVVADSAFSAGCQYASRTPDALPRSEKCKKSLHLVRSCANLISQLWYFPQVYRDGENSVRSFEDKHGYTTVALLQSITQTHLRDISKLCHMTDSDVLLLEDRRCPKQRKSELTKTMRECLMAIRTIDKPNIHRLREMVNTTLPLFSFIGRIGELVLEKTHQTLKRSIQQSNNRDIQLHAMSGAAFTDWQGRLAMIVRAVSIGDNNSIRCCYRLLAGRDAVAAMNGVISPGIAAKVVDALGPDDCIARELDAQGQLVLSPRAKIFGSELT